MSVINIDTDSTKSGEIIEKLCCSKYKVRVNGGVVIAISKDNLQVGDRVLLGRSGSSYTILQKTGQSSSTIVKRG